MIRDVLQRGYGEGGAGLVMPALPFSLYEMRDYDVPRVRGLEGRFVRGTTRTPGAYGRAGIALDVDRAATATLSPRASAGDVAHVELWAMAQTGGGSVTLRVGDHASTSIDTARGETGTLVRASLDVTPGAHRIAVSTDGDGPVRIFGVLAETATPGVVVEGFGVPGARARDQGPWSMASLTEQLAVRPPDLYAIAYGTNESGDGTALTSVEASLEATLDRLREISPGTACLVIGRAIDRGCGTVHGPARPRSAEVAALFHRQALAHGCAFFDTLAWQGGAGSMPIWVGAGLALSDHVHFTDEGYAMLARALLNELGVSRGARP